MEKEIPQEIQEFYRDLENLKSLDYWDFSVNLKPLKQIHDFDWRKVLSIEQLCLRFNISDSGDLISHFFNTDIEGKEVGKPEIQDFSTEDIEYLINRASNTKNPHLIARYNHIVFNSNNNQKHAIAAIKSYQAIIYNILSQEKQADIITIFPAVIFLTIKTKRNINEIKEFSFNVLESEKSCLWVKHAIINELIKSSLFKSYELKHLPEKVLEWINKEREPEYSTVKGLLNSCIKICIPNGLKYSIFYEKLAENEDLILDQHQEESDFLRSIIIGEQMDYYKKAKNLEKFDLKQKEYTEAKSKIELNLLEAPLGKELQQILNQDIKEKVEIMMTWEVDRIFNFFSQHTPLFPDYKEIVIQAVEKYDKSFLKHVSNSLFDLNINSKKLTEEESREHKIFEEYQMSLALGALVQFIQTVHFGVINSKINYAKLYKYLKENSWFGQDIQKPKMRTKKESQTYNWLNYMAPALHNFFIQYEQSFLFNTNTPHVHYMLALDSLTLKFEGALRDFIRLLGGSTYSFKNGNIQELLLESLLDSEIVKREFSENDIALFKMTFTKVGENIRNNIAHCFYHAADYTLEKTIRVLFCILRLGKYKLRPKENEE